jgi:hypothetical protein
MDTSIISIDDDLRSKVTRLINEDACKKRCLEGKAAELEQFLCSLSQMTGGERKQSILTALAVLKETDLTAFSPGLAPPPPRSLRTP